MTMDFPAIADVFHRTGAVEIWGRRTTRVDAACEDYGIATPTFEERQGFLLVTFRAKLTTGEVTAQVGAESRAESGPSRGQVAGQVTGQVAGQATPEVTPQVGPQPKPDHH